MHYCMFFVNFLPSVHLMHNYTISFCKYTHKTKCKIIGVLLDIAFADVKDAFPRVLVEGALLPAVNARFVSIQYDA